MGVSSYMGIRGETESSFVCKHIVSQTTEGEDDNRWAKNYLKMESPGMK